MKNLVLKKSKTTIRILLFLIFTIFGMCGGMLMYNPTPISELTISSDMHFRQGFVFGEIIGYITGIPQISFIIIQIVKSIRKTPTYSLGLFAFITILLCLNPMLKILKQALLTIPS